MSPFTGLSLITHLLICFLYKTALFFYQLLFGWKNRRHTDLLVLVRDRDEKILPPLVIGFVFSVMVSVAFVSVEASYQSTPNTFDLMKRAADSLLHPEKTQEKRSPAAWSSLAMDADIATAVLPSSWGQVSYNSISI